ncbi:MAG: chemotaxis protein [Candidatus Eremiobacteraeota bacterium]|nr:chemotaxis protein [Candidatus Eremiobacteraeota bacterium]MCW5870015.1 chemotaxis protein [Candidatus Eremiobacteraeota bacterium]
MPLYLAGIGASAGGLEAVRALLAHLPHTRKVAYVVAQHQAADSNAQKLVDLVQPNCPLRVEVARSGRPLAPDHVYWIPAGQDGRIDGQILLLAPGASLSKPSVDRLFQSVANNFGSRSAGLVLSGAGGDGARGCRAIQAAGGLTMAQSPESARFPGMPETAIQAGVVDRVLAPEKMGALLMQRLSDREAPPGMATLLELVHRATGVDFRGYKEETLQRRLQRRLSGLKLPGVDAYLELVRRQPEELGQLQQDFLVSLSGFFRDAECFAALAQELKAWLTHHRGPVRVWVPACATGEEAYSLAMLLVELLGAEQASQRCSIEACDLNGQALEVARRGIYSVEALEKLEPTRRQRHFVGTGNGYRVSELLRSMCRFQLQDVLTGSIPERLDLISCRNLLIYLQSGLQGELLRRFRNSLRPGGLLFLAPSETTGTLGATLFTPVDKQHRLYRRRGGLSA